MLKKIKNNKWFNLFERALWTFIQAFLGGLVVTGFTKEQINATMIAGIASGISALKTFILDYMKGDV